MRLANIDEYFRQRQSIWVLLYRWPEWNSKVLGINPKHQRHLSIYERGFIYSCLTQFIQWIRQHFIHFYLLLILLNYSEFHFHCCGIIYFIFLILSIFYDYTVQSLECSYSEFYYDMYCIVKKYKEQKN